MSDSRRKFLQKAGLLAGAFSASSLFNQLYAADIEYANKKVAGLSPGKGCNRRRLLGYYTTGVYGKS